VRLVFLLMSFLSFLTYSSDIKPDKTIILLWIKADCFCAMPHNCGTSLSKV
jgi:hypothetical protein